MISKGETITPDNLDTLPPAVSHCPDTVTPPSSQETSFPVVVEHIRSQGDVVDIASRSFWKSASVWGFAAAGFAAGRILEIEALPISVGLDLGLIAATTAVAVPAALGTRMNNKAVQSRIVRQTRDIPEALEIYRVKDVMTSSDEVVARWYGTAGPFYATEQKTGKPSRLIPGRQPLSAESLRSVSRLAEENDIKAVAIGEDILDDYIWVTERVGAEKVPAIGWLVGKKPELDLSVHNDTDLPLYMFTPDQLAKLAEEVEAKGKTDGTDLKWAIEYLRTHKPEHNLVNVYDDFHTDPELMRHKLQRAAVGGIERRLHDLAHDNGQRTRLDPPNRTAHHLHARVDDDMVQWSANGRLHDKQPLLRALGFMDEDTIKSILDDPEKHMPDEVITAIECAAARQQLQAPATTEAPLEQKHTVGLPYAPGLQLAISRSAQMPKGMFSHPNISPPGAETPVRVTNMKPMWKMLTSIAVGALAFAGPVIVEKNVAEPQIASLQRAGEAVYADQHLTHVAFLSHEQKTAADKAALAGHPILAADYAYRQYNKNLINKMRASSYPPQQLPAVPTKAKGSSSYEIPTGNNGAIDSQSGSQDVLWHVRPVGGVKTDGYWTVDTSEDYQPDGSWQAITLDGEGYTWGYQGGNSIKPTHEYYSTLPKTIDSSKYHDYIEVSRQLTSEDYVKMSDNGSRGTRYRIRLPILDGMEVLAVNYNNQAVKTIHRAAGTTAIQISGEISQNPAERQLTYDIAPIADTFNVSSWFRKPRALIGRHFSPSFYKGDDAIYDELEHSIDAAWDRYEAADKSSGSQDQLDRDVAYIRKHEHYNLTPLSSEFAARLHDGKVLPAEYVSTVLASHEAACDESNTAVALHNDNVAVAYGLLGGENNELRGTWHMWMIDRQGQIHDATPPIVKVDPPPVPSMMPLQAGTAAGGLTTAALGGILWRRRRAPQRAGRALRNYSAAELHESAQIFEMVTFARDGYQASKLTEAAELSAGQALTQVLRQRYHSSFTADGLSAALHAAPSRRDRAKLRRARKILRQAQTSGMVELLPPLNPLSGIIKGR
jgi:hypothetical protein